MSDEGLRFLEGQFASRDAEGAAPTPAATVVPLRSGPRGPEILFLRRGRTSAFGGMWVFPGGKVDPEDAGQAVARPGDPPGEVGREVAVARRAAVREAAEETQLVMDPGDLVVHSFWLPPPEAPRRFATWFFLAPVGPEGAVVVDLAEVREHRWLTAAEAIDERNAGNISLAPPTFVTVWQLLDAPDVPAALAAAQSQPPRRFLTRVRTSGGAMALVWEGDAAWPDGDPDAAGPRRRLWVSETDPWRAESPAEAS